MQRWLGGCHGEQTRWEVAAALAGRVLLPLPLSRHGARALLATAPPTRPSPPQAEVKPLFPVFPGPGCNTTFNLYSGTQMAKKLLAARQARDFLREARLFRAWITGFCQGRCVIADGGMGHRPHTPASSGERSAAASPNLQAGRGRCRQAACIRRLQPAECLPACQRDARIPSHLPLHLPLLCSHNTLFSGDGYTFTGTGGILSPLGREYIFAPFNVTWRPDEIASIPVCISARNGGKPVAGLCPLPTLPPAPAP